MSNPIAMGGNRGNALNAGNKRTIEGTGRTALYAGNKSAFLETGYQSSIRFNDTDQFKLFGGFGSGFENGSDLRLVGYAQYTKSYNDSNIGAEARFKTVLGNDNNNKFQLRLSPFTVDVPVSDKVSLYGNVNGTFQYNQKSENGITFRPKAFAGATYKGNNLNISAEINDNNLAQINGINDLELGVIVTYKF